MPIEPTTRIASIPSVKKYENTNLSQRKKPKQPKKNEKEEPGKIDIKV
ncbi:MAG: hypothetical protein ABSA46_04415 [Thermodesulfovibrionales bacterium]|jgi:hypothetical protein